MKKSKKPLFTLMLPASLLLQGTSFLKSVSAVLSILLMASLVGACSQSSSSNPPAANPSSGVTVTGTAEPADNTKILSKNAAEQITQFDLASGVLVINKGVGVLDEILPGDIINAPISTNTPYGALVKVVSATSNGDRWELNVERATLAEALKSADFSVQIDLDSTQATITPLAAGVAVASASKSLTTGVVSGDGKGGFTIGMEDYPVLDADDNYSTTDDQVRMTAAVFLDLGLNIGFRKEGGSVQGASVTITGKESGTIELVGEAISKTKERTLSEIHFLPIPFQVGPVTIVVVPNLDFVAGVNVDASAKFRTSATEEASFEFGPSYTGSGMELIKTGSASGSYLAPSFTGTYAEAKAGIGARAAVDFFMGVEMFLVKVGDAWAGATGFGKITATPANGSACATAEVGIDVGAGIDGTFFGIPVGVWSPDPLTIFAHALETKSCTVTGGTGEDPTLGWRYVADGTTDSLTGTQASAATHDGGLIFARSSNAFTYVQKHDGAGVVEWRYGTGISPLRLARVVAAANGDYIAAGTYGGTPVILRLDRGGNLRWAKTYADTGAGFVYAVGEGTDGTILLAGKMYDSSDTSDDAFLMKIAADGTNPTFLQFKGPAGVDSANAVIGSSGGRVYVGGSMESPAYGFVIAVNADNSISWQKGVAPGKAVALADDGAGGALIAGYGDVMTTGGLISAPWSMHVDGSGTRTWGTSLVLDVMPMSIAKTSDGAIVAGVADYAYGDKSNERGFVARFGNTGGVLWSRTFRYETREQELANVYERSDGRLIAGGYRVPYDGATELWWLSLPADGSGFGAPAGTEVMTPEATGMLLGSTVDTALTVSTRTATVSPLNTEWTMQTVPTPNVLSSP